MANIEETRGELQSKLRAAYTEALGSNETPRPLVLVRAPGGIGKTRMTASMLRHHRVTWLAPKNDHQGQLEGFLSQPLRGVAPLRDGVEPTLEKRPAREDAGWCPKFAERVLPLRNSGFGRFEFRRACAPCPIKKECRYLSWKPTAPWLFAPQVWLRLQVEESHLFEGREIVVIDESPLDHMLRDVVLQRHELEQLVQALPETGAGVDVSGFRLLLATCLDLITHPPAGRTRVALRSLAEDLGMRFGPMAMAPDENPVTLAPVSDDPAALQRLTDFLEKGPGPFRKKHEPSDVMELDAGTAARVIDAIRKGPRSVPSDVLERLPTLVDALVQDTRERVSCVLVLPGEDRMPAIAAGLLHPDPVPPELPVVVLDSTAEPQLYSNLFPKRRIIEVRADAEQTATIIQTIDGRYPARSLADQGTLEKILSVVEQHRAEHPDDKIAAIIKKQLFETARVKQLMLRHFGSQDIRYFWSQRGSNELEDYDAVFVIGAPEQAMLSIEARVRAFVAAAGPSGGIPLDLDRIPVHGSKNGEGFIDEDGVLLPERGFRQVGPDVVFFATHQAEYLQAILRARPFGTRKKTVYFLSSMWLPDLDFERVRIDELLGQSSAIQRALRWLREQRSQGRVGPITAREVAAAIGVSPPAISQAKKRIDDELLVEFRELLAGAPLD